LIGPPGDQADSTFTFYFTDTGLSVSGGSVTDPGTGDNSTGGGTAVTDYDATEVTHMDIDAEVASAVLLTIEKTGDHTVTVSVKSANSDPVDFITIGAMDDAAALGTMVLVDGVASIDLTWPNGSPATTSFEVLWSKESSLGNWMLDRATLGEIATDYVVSSDSGTGVVDNGVAFVLDTDPSDDVIGTFVSPGTDANSTVDDQTFTLIAGVSAGTYYLDMDYQDESSNTVTESFYLDWNTSDNTWVAYEPGETNSATFDANGLITSLTDPDTNQTADIAAVTGPNGLVASSGDLGGLTINVYDKNTGDNLAFDTIEFVEGLDKWVQEVESTTANSVTFKREDVMSGDFIMAANGTDIQSVVIDDPTSQTISQTI
jgi:hypothetical protein